MERTHRSFGFLDFALVAAVAVVIVLAAPYLQAAWQRMTAPAHLNAVPIAPPVIEAQPAIVVPTPNLYPEPTVPAPVVEYQPPAEAAPAGAPMSQEYQQTIQTQDRTNSDGMVCAPRSGCTKPGSAGPLPWPNGRP